MNKVMLPYLFGKEEVNATSFSTTSSIKNPERLSSRQNEIIDMVVNTFIDLDQRHTQHVVRIATDYYRVNGINIENAMDMEQQDALTHFIATDMCYSFKATPS